MPSFVSGSIINSFQNYVVVIKIITRNLNKVSMWCWADNFFSPKQKNGFTLNNNATNRIEYSLITSV